MVFCLPFFCAEVPFLHQGIPYIISINPKMVRFLTFSTFLLVKNTNFHIYFDILGRFKSKETDFRMLNSIIHNLTSTNQTKLFFNAKCLSRLWLH